jgi:hypothetical protein
MNLSSVGPKPGAFDRNRCQYDTKGPRDPQQVELGTWPIVAPFLLRA